MLHCECPHPGRPAKCFTLSAQCCCIHRPQECPQVHNQHLAFRDPSFTRKNVVLCFLLPPVEMEVSQLSYIMCISSSGWIARKKKKQKQKLQQKKNPKAPQNKTKLNCGCIVHMQSQSHFCKKYITPDKNQYEYFATSEMWSFYPTIVYSWTCERRRGDHFIEGLKVLKVTCMGFIYLSCLCNLFMPQSTKLFNSAAVYALAAVAWWIDDITLDAGSLNNKPSFSSSTQGRIMKSHDFWPLIQQMERAVLLGPVLTRCGPYCSWFITFKHP